jgi:hypothetical protein
MHVCNASRQGVLCGGDSYIAASMGFLPSRPITSFSSIYITLKKSFHLIHSYIEMIYKCLLEKSSTSFALYFCSLFYITNAQHLAQSFNSPFILNDTKLYFSLHGILLLIFSPLQATGKHFYYSETKVVLSFSLLTTRQISSPVSISLIMSFYYAFRKHNGPRIYEMFYTHGVGISQLINSLLPTWDGALIALTFIFSFASKNVKQNYTFAYSFIWASHQERSID